MSADKVIVRAGRLAEEGKPYVLATVVRVIRPASTRRGDRALVTPEGEITGWVGGSRVDGDAAAISAIQRSSAHYFQRPDQDHISFDSTRTSLSGWTA